ncbi:T9SS type A sorting domain-containing protein [Aequorivita antarctica]|uniref:T9SS type A sorting domain-containing protein n=1 Tax=Aequorivita antarctica TaxID=153266 RepID=A0A5C6YV04_9FLAO|nr:T9SS type A sorting domain-containing protein [Aequorivita antarctica]TXD71407.1 T9SS type A sorting domain-containing protein [Aequorivita antarctica]SRX76425.1 Poly(ethylene terephthalate) hydrolase [Aequorivita antarctica]
MKKIYAAALFFLATSFSPNTLFAQCGDVTIESLTNPGPYDVATLTEADGLRNGPDYLDATVYYPTNATPPFASIAIVPGFTALPSSVEEWGPFYASHGIVTIIIGTNSLFDFPEERAVALIDALETMRQENTRSSSPLENQLDVDKFAVSGWSMGGGGAQRAAVLDNTIKGVVALCPWLPNPSLNHDSPVLIFSGENDPTAPPAQHADLHYAATPETTNKLLFEIENGNHSVANTPDGGNGAVGKIALSWLKLYVDENDCYCPLLTESLLVDPPAASKVLSSFECELLSVPDNSFAISVYPNPTKDFVNINSTNPVHFEVYSALGQRLLSGELTQSEKQIDFSNFAKGLYYVHLGNETVKVIRN